MPGVYGPRFLNEDFKWPKVQKMDLQTPEQDSVTSSIPSAASLASTIPVPRTSSQPIGTSSQPMSAIDMNGIVYLPSMHTDDESGTCFYNIGTTSSVPTSEYHVVQDAHRTSESIAEAPSSFPLPATARNKLQHPRVTVWLQRPSSPSREHLRTEGWLQRRRALTPS